MSLLRWLSGLTSLGCLAIMTSCGGGPVTSSTSPLLEAVEASVTAVLMAEPIAIGAVVQQNPAAVEPLSPVTIQGDVIALAPLLNGQLYQLQDATGTIWVLTATADVQLGDRLLIEGQPEYAAIPLAGADQGEFYILEQQRQHR